MRSPQPKLTFAALGLLLALVTVAAYIPATGAGFIWDDDDYVSENRALRDGNGLARIWLELGATPQYYPLTFTTFWAEYRLWGLNSTGYHATNIILHACSAILLWVILRALALPGAFFLAALWALHPLQVESVAWISERKNVLSGLFYFGALLAWLRIDGPGVERKDESRRRKAWYAVALLLFVCALLSKTVTTSLPAVFLIIMWWKKRPIGKREFLPVIPFFLTGAAISSITIWMERFHVSARGVDWEFSFIERCLIAGRAFWFYPAKLAAPVNLSFSRDRVGRGSLAAVLFFGVTIAPALGFIDVYPMRYSFAADHFQYLAGIGPLLLAGSLIRSAARRLAHPDLPLAVLALLFAALTWGRSGTYVDLETLWRDTVAKSPECWMAHNNLGIVLQENGDPDGALRCYERSLEIDPGHARPHSNAGTILLEQNRVDDAIARFRESIRLNPGYADARFNLGRAFEVGGRVDPAVAQYRSTIDLAPSHTPARYNLANLLARSGATGEAITLYSEVLLSEPDHLQAHVNLGNTLAMEKRMAEAADQYRRVLHLNPDHAMAHRNLGNVLAESGERAEAARHYREAVRLRPDWTELEKVTAEMLVPAPSVSVEGPDSGGE